MVYMFQNKFCKINFNNGNLTILSQDGSIPLQKFLRCTVSHIVKNGIYINGFKPNGINFKYVELFFAYKIGEKINI